MRMVCLDAIVRDVATVIGKKTSRKSHGQCHGDEAGMVESTDGFTKQTATVNSSDVTVNMVKQTGGDPQPCSQYNESKVNENWLPKTRQNTKFVATLQAVSEDDDEEAVDSDSVPEGDESKQVSWSTDEILKAQSKDLDI